MFEMSEILNYFRKLQRVINYDATFTFAGRAFVKKSKIDDLLCCIIATLPESYKKMMRSDESKNLKSVLCYNSLFNAIKQRCFFNSNVYQVHLDKANRYITSILATLEQDIKYAERIF